MQKLQDSACAEFLDGLPVSLLECFPAFGSRRAVSGFGLGLLVRQGFLGVKAPPGPLSLFCAIAPGCLHSLSLGRHDCFCDGLPVSVLECFLVFGTRRAVSGFGLGLLVSSGFLGAKAGHSDRAVRRVEESCFGFGKSKANSTFCKVVKQKGEGKPTLSMRWFPLSLRPSPLPFTDQGAPLDP